jgi:hypothetical protein
MSHDDVSGQADQQKQPDYQVQQSEKFISTTN